MTDATLLGSAQPLNAAFDAALVDLDGVTYRGPEPIPSAPPALTRARQAGMKIVFVTNNASRTPEQVAEHLSEVGIEAAPDEVMTAAQAAAAMLGERLHAGDRVLVVGGRGLREAVAAQGLEVVESATDNPAAVVQGFAPEVGWKHLAEAAYAVRAGAWFVASNLDKTLPNERGLAPGNGSLVAAVVTAAGVEPDSAGKPSPSMFRAAAAKVGAQRPLVIGDRLDTDLAGARAAQMPGLMVLTGVNDVRDAALAPPAYRPSFIAATLDGLDEPHSAPTRDGEAFAVGDAVARVVAGELRIDGEGIDAARAGIAAAWAAADAGGAVKVESLGELGLS